MGKWLMSLGRDWKGETSGVQRDMSEIHCIPIWKMSQWYIVPCTGNRSIAKELNFKIASWSSYGAILSIKWGTALCPLRLYNGNQIKNLKLRCRQTFRFSPLALQSGHVEVILSFWLPGCARHIPMPLDGRSYPWVMRSDSPVLPRHSRWPAAWG